VTTFYEAINLAWTRYAVIEIGVCLLDVAGSDLAI
jgi:hypothetical protein